MSDPTTVFERSAARYQAPDLSIEAVLRRRDVRRRNQRIRTASFAVLVAAVAIGGLIRSFDRPAVPGSADPPEAVPSVSQAPPATIDGPPPGVETTMTIPEVERYVLDLIEQNEVQVGGALAPARIVSVTYVEPKERYRARGGGVFFYPFPAWAVEYEGTYLGCGSYCTAFPGGMEIFADARDPGMHAGGGSAVGEACLVTAPGTGTPPRGTKLEPCVVPPPPSPAGGTSASTLLQPAGLPTGFPSTLPLPDDAKVVHTANGDGMIQVWLRSASADPDSLQRALRDAGWTRSGQGAILGGIWDTHVEQGGTQAIVLKRTDPRSERAVHGWDDYEGHWNLYVVVSSPGCTLPDVCG